jgi:hypothetical protein
MKKSDFFRRREFCQAGRIEGCPRSSPLLPPRAPPPLSPPTERAPLQQQGLPSVGDMEPDWGHGSGNHISDEGPDWAGHPYMDGADFNSAHRADDGADWGSHPMMSDPDWHSGASSARRGYMFRRLSLRR